MFVYTVRGGAPRLTQQYVWSWKSSTPRRTDRLIVRPSVRRNVALTWYPKVALGQVCLRVLRCFPVIIPPMPHTYSLIFEASCKRTDGRSVGPFTLNMMLVQKSRVSRRKNIYVVSSLQWLMKMKAVNEGVKWRGISWVWIPSNLTCLYGFGLMLNEVCICAFECNKIRLKSEAAGLNLEVWDKFWAQEYEF